ncbi:hypothetical protein PR202_gb09927 [Eleusine coracana subsp. coracana]|uniref:Cyclin-dependent kinase inhibitor domain-containing protein n=1 Tax=Eleusine coracana subsp. coracana TaxID=191504 RepID=A0AAV5EIM1_ELECO|nr:hypothetical protein QOZ80_2BG0202240 [Eleusine coracana subsp. coracana]GJN22371.1 hypothetical protein PR202_gb09927 [Eleusine coracana subsp. coracana]
MGKYMRKCRGAAGEAVEVTQVVGVRTRSRAASSAAGGASGGGVAKVVQKRKKVLPPATTEMAAEPSAAMGSGGSCYLQLRSRMLFKAPSSSSPLKPPSTAEAAGHGAPPLMAVLSRCSSTASSVDASAQEKSAACRCDGSEAGGDHVPEGSVCNSGCGQDRDRRETTPSSQARVELSDLESDLAGQKSGRSLPAAASPVRPIRPPAAEIEEFFAAAEAAEAQRFASKYNFDVVRGVPLHGGRFEWTPVVSI